MQKKTGHFLCHLLGAHCLLASVLVSTGQAQSGTKTISAPLAASSPAAQFQLSAQPSRHPKILPSRIQQIAAALREKLQRRSIPLTPRSISAVAPEDSAPAPNFGGFAGVQPPFVASNYQADCGTYGYCGLIANVTGDFNGDGLPDIAVIQETGEIYVLLGDGKGGFAAPIVTGGQSGCWLGNNGLTNVTAADLNGDGKADLLVYGSAISVCMNKGDGTFPTPVVQIANKYSNQSSPAFAVADVNGDGHPDILIADDTNQNLSGGMPDSISVQTLLNNGDGTFPSTPSQVATYPVPAGYSAQVLVNTAIVANLAGKPTLLFAVQEWPGGISQSPPYSPYVFQASSNGDGTFTFGAPMAVPSVLGAGYNLSSNHYGRQLLVQDLNNDGAPDILIAPGDGYIYSALGAGGGSFAAPVQAVSGSGIFIAGLELHDLDGDGVLDLVSGNDEFAATFRGNGDGTFTLVNAITTGSPSGGNIGSGPGQLTAFGVFNQDGKLDFVTADNNYGAAALHAGQGGFNFAGASRLSDTGAADQSPALPDQLSVLATLDLNGDGKTDLLGFNFGDPNALYQIVAGVNQGGGNFKWIPEPNLDGLSILALGISPATGDFNHDGKPDVIFYTADTSYHEHIYVALSSGDGTLQKPIEIALPAPVITNCMIQNYAAGDVNGDGNLDIVMTYGNPNGSMLGCGSTTAGYYVALGDGTGKFSTAAFTPFGTNLDLVQLADMNGDGALDMILSNLPDGTTPSLMVLLNNGKGNFSRKPPLPISYTEIPVVLQTGDLNQDGKTDLAISSEGVYSPNSNNGQVDYSQSGIVIYSGNGDGTAGEPTVINPGQIPVITLADFNGDGLPDILSALLINLRSAPPSITDPFYGASLLLNTGKGSFAPPINTFVPYGAEILATGNFYGDGATDLLVEDQAGITMLYNQGGSTLTLSASGSSVTQGDTVTLTARLVAAFPSRPVPTGSITFYDGKTALGSAALDGTGTASYTASSLSAGSHTITATYAGDANFNPAAQTGSVAIAVAALPPSFDLASSSSSVTLAKNGSSPLTLTLTPNATFNGPVTLTATGVPAGVTVQFSNATIQLVGAKPVQVPATISTGKTTASAAKEGRTPWMNAGAGISIAGLLLIGFPRRRRIWPVAMLVLATLSLAALASMTGCGGSSNSPKAGSTQITITATPSGSGAAAQSTTVTLTIQ